MRDERLSREEADRLEAEILAEKKRVFKEAALELMKDHPREIYLCALEVIKLLRADQDRSIMKRAALLRELGILLFIAAAALAWYWTRH
jgi:hypothetical protein